VLIVADPPRVDDLAVMFDDPLPFGFTEILRSTGGDDTIELAEARRPYVCVITASLEGGDAAALIDALRGMMPRAEVAIVLIGDADGPMRTALDALDLAPDRFVSSPVVPKALRFAVGGALEAVALVRGSAKAEGSAAPEPLPDEDPTLSQRAAQRARWEALANSFVEIVDEEEVGADPGEDAEPLPPPDPPGRRHTDSQAPTGVPAPLEVWQPGTTSELREKEVSQQWSAPEPPVREPTLILTGPEPSGPMPEPVIAMPPPLPAPEPAAPEKERTSGVTDPWAGAMPLAELIGTEARAKPSEDDFGLDDFEDDLVLGHETSKRNLSEPRLDVIDDLADAEPLSPIPAVVAGNAAQDGRDFARQLRAKMSMMAQRLFQGGDAASSPAIAVDLRPGHDHHTEIDLTSLGEEPALERGNTEIEGRSSQRSGEIRDLTTSPGSWDTQIRERGLPDTGEISRGVSDASMLLAKMFAQASTGRITFRQEGMGSVEKVVFFDQGRPVFASSSEPRDRMGELLVREGKITAAQYERCQAVVAESGRRMGEILVDFGYLKRRELLPAVRRHVEDIVYSLFQWDRGTYHIALDATPSSERIRLSRHPAALILEGIRRKLDRTSLERLIGSASTVIEVPDRERLGGIINLGDLAVEERSALAAFDANADLSAVARAAGVDVADVLPLAWGLCVLGLATARRTDTEVPDESSALVGETDLAIDRERVRARWELVSEADYFALLGVRRDATAFEIRRAYQSARRDFATDSFPNDLRRELAQELDDIAHVLDEAFRVLRDDRLRVTYLSNLVE
jgi:DNA-binding NarL/FixJ family response regulator